MSTFKSYLTGFILSIILTLAAYFAVVNHYTNALIIILVLAILQFCVQAFFFLHLHKGIDKEWNITIFVSTLSIVLIVIIGTIWIMSHLNYNMTPGQMNDYLMKDEGMKMK